MPAHTGAVERTFGAAALLLAMFWVAVAFYALHMMLPYNAVALPAEDDVKARIWAPQGWKFFTRNPREDWLIPFVREAGGKWRLASVGPNGTASAFFGLSRVPRAQGIEMGLLLYKLPSEVWGACERDPRVCLEKSPIKMTLHNRLPDATLCGIIGMVRQRQIPWAWDSRGVAPKNMPSRVAKFEVKCSKQSAGAH